MTKREFKQLMTGVSIVVLLAAAFAGWDAFQSPPVHAASQFATIVCDNFKPVSTTGNVQVITAGATSQFIYICSYNLNIGTPAQAVAFVEGTGATCGTNTVGVVGGATGATGLQFAANGTVNFGGGTGAVAKTSVAGDNVCLFLSGTTQTSGVISWTSAPY